MNQNNQTRPEFYVGLDIRSHLGSEVGLEIRSDIGSDLELDQDWNDRQAKETREIICFEKPILVVDVMYLWRRALREMCVSKNLISDWSSCPTTCPNPDLFVKMGKQHSRCYCGHYCLCLFCDFFLTIICPRNNCCFKLILQDLESGPGFLWWSGRPGQGGHWTRKERGGNGRSDLQWLGLLTLATPTLSPAIEHPKLSIV